MGKAGRLFPNRYSPSVFSRRQAKLLDRVLANLSSFEEPKRSLLTLLIVKWSLRVQPMSMLHGTDARAAFSGDLDRVSPRRLGHYLRGERLLEPNAWWQLASEVNSGVFPGTGEAFQEDAVRFLAHSEGDVVYLDPPYPGTTSYEKEYAVLDGLLEGEVSARSSYSQSSDALGALFDACRSVPVWVVSLNNTVLSVEQLTACVRKFRRSVRAITIRHRHLASIASEKKNAENREYLILATI